MTPFTRIVKIAHNSKEYREACELRHQYLRKPLGLDLYSENLAAERQYSHYALLENETVRGYAQLIEKGPNEIQMRQMVLHPELRDRGHGRTLLKFLEQEVKKRGISRLFFHARKSAAEFYRKMGYVTEGEEFIWVKIPHVIMSKKLQ